MSYRIDNDQSIPEAFFRNVSENPQKPAYSRAIVNPATRERTWNSVTFEEVFRRVGSLAAFLRAKGVGRVARVAIISNSRPEWMEADLAILSCGGITVSVYQSLTPAEVGYILFDSGAEVLFVENEEQLQKVLHLRVHQCQIPATEERPEFTTKLQLKEIVTFERTSGGAGVTFFGDIVAEPSLVKFDFDRGLKRDDTATLVYTSGTTGPAKGVVQTHGNHLSNIRQARQAGIFEEGMSIFIILPFAHSFAKLMGYIGFLWGIELKFPSIGDTKTSKVDPAVITRDLREGDAQVIPIVPRLLEKMQAGIEAKAHHPTVAGGLISMTIANGRQVAKAKASQRFPGITTSLLWRVLTPIREKIKHEIFGREFLYAISGGAKLPVPVAEFFDALGIEVLEGYGLTETCVATNVNPRGRKKIGTVGPVLAPDIEIKIADDGEILFKGPNITKQYYRRDVATKAAWDSEGWFHSGDLGSVDSNRYLSITGRKKELIVSSGGKKIAPDHIEGLIKQSPLISQAVMAGEGRQYCVALIVINRDGVLAWAKTKGIELSGDFAADKRVKQAIWEHVEVVNKELASYESIKKIHLLSEEFTMENGLLTPTLKIKRNLVYKRYEAEIAGMY